MIDIVGRNSGKRTIKKESFSTTKRGIDLKKDVISGTPRAFEVFKATRLFYEIVRRYSLLISKRRGLSQNEKRFNIFSEVSLRKRQTNVKMF